MFDTTTTFSEKDPLLPLDQHNACCCNNEQRANRHPYFHTFRRFFHSIIICLALYSLWKYMDESLVKNDEAIIDAAGIWAVDEQKVQQNDLHTQSCHERPVIPLEDNVITFNDELFTSLSVKHRLTVGRHSIQLVGGRTRVRKNEDVANTTVTISINGSNENLANVFWIEQFENVIDRRYEIVIHQEQQDSYIDGGCVVIDVNVDIPGANSMAAIASHMPSNTVTLDGGLSFVEGIDITTANGDIEFEEGISSGNAIFRTANGHITGTFVSLSGNLDVSMANGVANIRAKEIINGENDSAISISGSSANGGLNIYLPRDFNSQFRLSGVSRSKRVEAANLSKIHYDRYRWGWGPLKGYFGDDKNVRDRVSLSTANGKLLLSYTE